MNKKCCISIISPAIMTKIACGVILSVTYLMYFAKYGRPKCRLAEGLRLIRKIPFIYIFFF